MFSLSLISPFKQTSSIRFFSPSVNSVMFASSPWMRTVHIISNPLVCLRLKSGQALWVKSGPFLGLERIKEFRFLFFFLHRSSHKLHKVLSVCRKETYVAVSITARDGTCCNEIHTQELTPEANHLWCFSGLNIDIVLFYFMATHTVLKMTPSCFQNFSRHSCTSNKAAV